jgi:phosphoribosylformimino-5-aminoimidazole carboxamide ribotide isomerase
VILGTAAVTDPAFLEAALRKYGEKIAVGVDLKDGFVAIKGWTETSGLTAGEFFAKMEALGVKTVICTDISRDGAMQGTNRQLYKDLSQRYAIDLIASGGVSDLEDIRALAAMNIHGAIVGKAYYIGAIDLAEAIKEAT